MTVPGSRVIALPEPGKRTERTERTEAQLHRPYHPTECGLRQP